VRAIRVQLAHDTCTLFGTLVRSKSLASGFSKIRDELLACSRSVPVEEACVESAKSRSAFADDPNVNQ
jgi:hypothetical protein